VTDFKKYRIYKTSFRLFKNKLKIKLFLHTSVR